MKSYLVGGAVRDTLLGRSAKDRDFVVIGATPEMMLRQGFEQVGQGFPVFLHPVSGEEYALARRERKVGAGYTGFEFETGGDVTLFEDLGRRDLTINSMALDSHGNLVDPYGGAADIVSKQLRHTSDAFSEDPLRVIRLARFYARYKSLCFTVASETMQLASEMVARGDLDELPYERFWAELEKAFSDENAAAFFGLLYEVGALEKVAFFKELFGGFSVGRLETWLNLVRAAQRLKPEDRLDVFVACVMQHKGPYNTARAQKMHKMLGHILDLGSHPTAFDWHSALSKCRAFADSRDLILALFVLEEGLNTPAKDRKARLVEQLVEAGRSVTSDNYQHLSGKAVGDAMAKERIDRIEAVLSKLS